MDLIFRRDAGMVGFSKEVLLSMDKPDYIVYLMNKAENKIAFKGMKKSGMSLYLKDAFDIPQGFYESSGNSVYGIEGAFFIGEMLDTVGVDGTFFRFPISFARDRDGDICLITKLQDAISTKLPRVTYILSDKQERLEMAEVWEED